MIGRSSASETVTVKDVPADRFIAAYAAHLKKTQKVTPLEGHEYLKTAHYKDVAPLNEDWYYVRAAAVARKLYLKPRIGVGRLRHLFGSVKRNGMCHNKHAKAAGKIIRHSMQQLEKAGVLTQYVDEEDKSMKFDERVVSREGQKEMNEVAKNVFNAMFKKNQDEE